MNTLAYARVSDPRQATEDKTSLTAQRAAIEALAARLGRTVDTDGWHTEPGVSGGTADRPAFQRMIAYCEAHPRKSGDGLVLCYNDSRFGRFDNPEESTYWRVRFHMAGWTVRFATNDETSDPTARGVLRAISQATASQERQTIRERARMGVRGAAAKGLVVNKEPFGYRRLATDPVTGGTRVLNPGQRKAPGERLTLTLGPDAEVEFVRWLFTSYASGRYTLAQLVREAPTRYPKTGGWLRRTLHQMLRNPTYSGDVVIGRRASDLLTPIVGRDAHPAIVDRETMAAVRKMLARNQRETGNAATRGYYPLSGLVSCAQCGQAFVGGGGRVGKVDPESERYYRDSGASKGGCPGHLMTFRRRDVEPLVVDAIAGVLEATPVEELVREAVEQLRRSTQGDHTRQRETLEKSRDEDKRKLERIVSAVADGVLQAEDAKAQAAAIRGRIADGEEALQRLQFDRRRVGRLEEDGERLVGLTRDFRAMARRVSGADLRELLRPWIHSAVVDKHERTLTLDISPPDVRLFTLAHPGPARRCSRAGCPRSCLL